MKINEKLKKGDVVRCGDLNWLLIDWCRTCRKLWLQGVDGKKTVNYKDAKLIKA